VKALLKIVAALSATSVALTVWLIVSVAVSGGLSSLATSGPLGVLTLVGWVVSLIAGPFAAFRLWTYHESGRRAGTILFGYGLIYYVVGLFLLRAPGAYVGQILAAASMYAIPLVVLALPAARDLCRNQE